LPVMAKYPDSGKLAVLADFCQRWWQTHIDALYHTRSGRNG